MRPMPGRVVGTYKLNLASAMVRRGHDPKAAAEKHGIPLPQLQAYLKKHNVKQGEVL